MSLPDPLVRLIDALQRLPGIGPKGAQRLAFHILKTPREQVDELVAAATQRSLEEVRAELRSRAARRAEVVDA